MSFNQNEALYLLQGLQFKDPKIYDLLNKMINSLAEIDKSLGPLGDTLLASEILPIPWVPTDQSGAALAFTYAFPSQYVKIGRLVVISGNLTYPVTASGANAIIGGLPFPATTQFAFQPTFTDFGATFFGVVSLNSVRVDFIFNLAGALLTNANLSAKTIKFSTHYFTPT